MKVKIFSADKPEKLEPAINNWLEDNKWVIVKTMTQSSSNLTCIAIWYEEPDVPILE
ncbi:MAG TPA: hypothetical protein VHQ46_03385 [Desulfobacteria bacterium]|nr:hypothetical protein [Desulfobacteria bacterium]